MSGYPSLAPESQIYQYCPKCTSPLREDRDPVNAWLRPTCVSCGWVYVPRNPVAAIAVVETSAGIVMTHPPNGGGVASASLPGVFLEYGETPESGLARGVWEQTGFEVETVSELVRFQQLGTPFGPALMFGFRMRVLGGRLRRSGPEGPAVIYPLNDLPAILPVRQANRRVLEIYLASATAG